MQVGDALGAAARREQELQRELQRAYESLTEITSRLLLANEAAEATLSSHIRTELSERFLTIAARGLEVSRAAVFLVESGSFSVGSTVGLDAAEEAALESSLADVAACRRALESAEPLVVDSELVADDLEIGTRAGARDAAGGDDGGTEGEEAGAAVVEEGADDEDGKPVDAGAEEGSPEESGDGDGPGRPLFGLYLPVHLEGEPAAVLALGERSGGQRFRNDDLLFLDHLLRQFAVALHRSTLIEQNQERLRQLDALLKVSREITSTFDLDAVLRTVVNTLPTMVENDRAEVLLLKGDRLSLRVVSGLTRLDPDQVQLLRLDGPLEYLQLNPARLHLAAGDLDDRPASAAVRVFREYFAGQEMHSFMALPLRDEQGLLGFLCLESRQDVWDIAPAEGDTLEILAAQTTVAIRNARLYSELPLRGVALPVSRIQAWLRGLTARRRVATLGLGVATLLLLSIPLFPERAGGPAVVRPSRFQGAHATSEGVISRVLVQGGEEVRKGQPLAWLEDLDLSSRISDLEGEIQVIRRQLAAARQSGDVTGWRTSQIQLAARERTLSFQRGQARATVLRAPLAGRILELDLGRQAGHHLEAGDLFCTVMALDVMGADLEIGEEKVGRIQVGQRVAMKLGAFPTRTFRGRVTEVGWRARPGSGGSARFIVRGEFENPGRALRVGMTGVGRVSLGRKAIGALALEPLTRAIQLGWW